MNDREFYSAENFIDLIFKILQSSVNQSHVIVVLSFPLNVTQVGMPSDILGFGGVWGGEADIKERK